MYLWYKSIPTYVQEKCDPSILRVLTELQMTMEEARVYACTVVDIVGGPTAAQSAFITTIIGLSTGIFGLYVATGRKWDKSDLSPNSPFPYPQSPPNPYGPSQDQPTYGPRHPPSYGPPSYEPPSYEPPVYGPSRNDPIYRPRPPSDGREPQPTQTGPWGKSGTADNPTDDLT